MKNKTATQRLMYFIICYAAYTAVYIARLNLSSVAYALEKTGIANKNIVGIMGSVFFIVFSIGRLVNGFLGDRIKPERFMSLGLVVIGISNILVGMIPKPVFMILFWGANAYGQSMLWGAVLRTLVNAYGQEKAKIMTAYVITATATGNILGVLVGTFAQKIGASYAFYVPGIIAILIAIVVSMFVKTKKAIKKTNENASILELIRDKRVKEVMLPVLLHGVIKDNINMWCVLYFSEKFGLSGEYAAMFVFAIPIVGFLGRIIYPTLYRKMNKNEHTVALVSFCMAILCCAILSVSSIHMLVAAVALSVLSAAIMIINTSYLSIFPMRFYEDNAISASSGVMDLFTYIGAGIGSAVYGLVITYAGYEAMYFSWALISVASVLILKRVHGKSVNNKKIRS